MVRWVQLVSLAVGLFADLNFPGISIKDGVASGGGLSFIGMVHVDYMSLVGPGVIRGPDVASKTSKSLESSQSSSS